MEKRRVALIGNPGVGKSTVFHEITAPCQHTELDLSDTQNLSSGEYYYKYNTYTVTNLLSTYSLLSYEDNAAKINEQLLLETPDCVVVVADSSNLSLSLNLILQVIQITKNVVLLLNFSDIARARNIFIDDKCLSKQLGVPVVTATARSGKGINELLEEIHLIVTGARVHEGQQIVYVSPIEQAIRRVQKGVPRMSETIDNSRFLALCILQNNLTFVRILEDRYKYDLSDDFDVMKGREILSRFNLSGNNLGGAVSDAFYKKADAIQDESVDYLPVNVGYRKQYIKIFYLIVFAVIFSLSLISFIFLTMLLANESIPLLADFSPISIYNHWYNLCISFV